MALEVELRGLYYLSGNRNVPIPSGSGGGEEQLPFSFPSNCALLLFMALSEQPQIR